jgi:hypothetical protein
MLDTSVQWRVSRIVNLKLKLLFLSQRFWDFGRFNISHTLNSLETNLEDLSRRPPITEYSMYFLAAFVVKLAQGNAFHRPTSSAPITKRKSRFPWL